MDQVSARGLTTRTTTTAATFRQLNFDFSRQTSLGTVSGTGRINVEIVPNSTGNSQSAVGTPSLAKSVLVTDVQVVNGAVRVTGDLAITLQTLPGVLRTLQQNRPVLPPGFNPLTGIGPALGGLR
jgi:hypothetical protein